jgi:DNA-binding NarL/FixJ family response regulator
MTWRVVLVDDDAEVRKLLNALVSSEKDFEVVGEACDGVQASSVVELRRPDAVLLDLNMANRDGLTALSAIHSACPEVVAVIVSGAFAPQNVQEAAARGASGFMAKGPDLAGELVPYLRAVLTAGHQSPALGPN